MSLPPKASFSTTETQVVHSISTNQDYQISIGLPFSYRPSSDLKYPLVVVLDGNLFFNLLTDTARLMHLSNSFPEVIVVGIGYPLKNLVGDDFKRFVAHRVKDFTPVQSNWLEGQLDSWLGGKRIETGGAKNFLDFIREELLPNIESRYNADPSDRTLVGHSLAGLFALHALFQEPRVFHRYVAGSPALGYAEQSLFLTEDGYAQINKDLPADLYLAIGSEDESLLNPLDAMISIPDFYRFAAFLQKRAYPGLRLTRTCFEGHTQFSIPAQAFQAGLRAVFSG
jgi:predicted alpha/beta superfamily hydrolase